MRDRFRAKALLALISTATAACGASQSSIDAANATDGGAADVATGDDGPAGFFIMGDIDGQTWLATHNIAPAMNNFLGVLARVEPAPPTREWQFNFTLTADPFPYTLDCVTGYIEFHEVGIGDEREFVSRTTTSHCEVTFVEPSVPGTVEGTFTANLRLRGTMTDYAVTNGRFRLPLAP